MKIELTGNRRTFMKSAVMFSGLAALLGIAKASPAKPKAPAQGQKEQSRGYCLTEHVKKYYETARL